MASFLAKKSITSGIRFHSSDPWKTTDSGKKKISREGKDIRLGFGRSLVKGHLRPTAVNILFRLLGGNSDSLVRKTERAAISGAN